MSDAAPLARQAPFRLGALTVEPAARRVAREGQEVFVQPRVMQVLVTLAEAKGGVIGRDELIERCWGGLAVSESAINRVISHLRGLAEDFGGAFHIDTVARVGYRLRVPDGVAPESVPGQPASDRPSSAHPAPPVSGPPPTRRALLLAGGAALLTGGGSLALWQSGRAQRAAQAEAVALAEKGASLLHESTYGGTVQARAFYTRATERDPGLAAAWGGLAVANVELMEGSPAEIEGYATRAREAAARALSLDPQNGDALFALAASRGTYRRWQAAEAEFGPLWKQQPDNWYGAMNAAIFMGDTGRWSAAIPWLDRAIRTDPLGPKAFQQKIVALWNTGQFGAAEREIESAQRVFPNQFWIWLVRFNFLALSGRPGAALAQIEDETNVPEQMTRAVLELSRLSARALQSRAAADIAAAVAAHKELRARGAYPSLLSFMYLSGLGARAEALAMIEDYYLGKPDQPGGPRRMPGPRDDRTAGALFTQPLVPLRTEPRFLAVLRAIGLENYWEAAGITPDFRR